MEKILFTLAVFLPIYYIFILWLHNFQTQKKLEQTNYQHSWGSKNSNFWLYIEVPLFIMSIGVFFDPLLQIIIFPIMYYFLIFFNIFVIGKIFRKKMPKVKFSIYTRLPTFIYCTIIISIYIFFFLNFHYWHYIFITTIWLMLFVPLIFKGVARIK